MEQNTFEIAQRQLGCYCCTYADDKALGEEPCCTLPVNISLDTNGKCTHQVVVHDHVAIGPYCWGRGATDVDAIREMKINWPKSAGKVTKAKYRLYMIPKDAYVNDMGNITRYTKSHDARTCDICNFLD